MIYDLKVSTNSITKANFITESLIFKDEIVRFGVPGLEIRKGKRIPLVAPVRSVLVSAAIAQDVMETFQAYHLERGPGAASSSRALLTDVALVTAVPSTPVNKGALTRSGPRYYGYNGPPGSLGPFVDSQPAFCKLCWAQGFRYNNHLGAACPRP